ATFLLDRAVDEIIERLDAVLRFFHRAVVLGPASEPLGRSLQTSGKVGNVMRVAVDEEALPFRDESLDLVLSALSLQFVNDLPGTLVQVRRALRPDGLFLAAMLGGDTLNELRAAFAEAEAEMEGGVSPRVA